MPHKKKLKINPLLAALPYLPMLPATVPSALTLKQTGEGEDMEWKRKGAKASYPDLNAIDAFNKHVMVEQMQDIFFENVDGERCIWREQLNPWTKRFGRKLYENNCGDEDGRKFLVTTKSGRGPPPKHVDRLRSKKYRTLIAHRSEVNGGWDLPRDHPRHLLNFHIDLLDLIFSFVLQIPPTNECMMPNVVTCNWVTAWSSPGFEVNESLGPDHIIEIILSIQRQDNHGPYTEYRKLFRSMIDARILRTSKEINQYASKFLYRNVMRFRMVNPSWYCSPPSGIDGRVYRPKPYKPAFSQARLEKVISHIQNQPHFKALQGWVYYDYFLRFLHTIGPHRAALIETLEFSGRVKAHTCNERSCGRSRCKSDLVLSLKYYLPVIARFCTRLRELTLFASEDTIRPAKKARTFEEALTPLLENEIRQIDSLENFRLLKSTYEKDVNGCDHTVYKPVIFAQPTIRWLKERVAKKGGEAAKTMVLTAGRSGQLEQRGM